MRALALTSTQRFCLMSESCIPLLSFGRWRRILLANTKSIYNACPMADEREMEGDTRCAQSNSCLPTYLPPSANHTRRQVEALSGQDLVQEGALAQERKLVRRYTPPRSGEWARTHLDIPTCLSVCPCA